jgi:hypothetical protein
MGGEGEGWRNKEVKRGRTSCSKGSNVFLAQEKDGV